jgi:hypothetical protein
LVFKSQNFWEQLADILTFYPVQIMMEEAITMTVYSKLNETLCTLQGITSTLKIYAMQTDQQEIKNVFNDAALFISQVAGDLKARMKTLEYEEPQYKGF